MGKKMIIIGIFVIIALLPFIVLSIGIIHPIINKDIETGQDESLPDPTEDIVDVAEVPENASDFYTITLVDRPIYEKDMREVTFSLNIENINTTPYITNIEVYECFIEDTAGVLYSARPYYGNSVLFDKAIIPQESTVTKFTRVGFEFNILKEGEVACRRDQGDIGLSLLNMEKCVYNSSGECVCSDVGKFVLQSCKVGTSNQGKEARMHPQIIKFY